MKNKVLFFTVIMAVLVSLVAACAPKPAPEVPKPAPEVKVIELVVNNPLTPTHPQGGLPLMKWAEEVEKGSEGRIKVTVIHAGALFGAFESLPGLQTGGCDVSWIGMGWYTKEFPYTGPGSTIIDFKRGVRWTLDDQLSTTKELCERFEPLRMEGERLGIKFLFYTPSPQLGIVGKIPLTKLEDLKGRRIRVYSKLHSLLFEGVGAVPVSMPAPDAYTAFQTGGLDFGFSFIDGVHRSYGFFEVAKYYNFIGENGVLPPIVSSGFFMNPDSWNRLPPDLQKVILEASEVAEVYAMGVLKQGNKDACELFKQLEWCYLDTEELARWDKEFPDAYALASDIINEMGEEGTQFIEELRKVLR